MGRITGKLKHGLFIGEEAQTEFVLHDHLTASMIMQAKEASEKVHLVEVNGQMQPVVVESPARLGALMLCQQIESVGIIAGPLDYSLFEKLHEEDLQIINLYAEYVGSAITADQLAKGLAKLAQKASPEVTQRGRHSDAGENAGGDGSQAD